MTTLELEVVAALKRIAEAQETLVSMATEARKERLELADKMKQHFRAGFNPAGDESK